MRLVKRKTEQRTPLLLKTDKKHPTYVEPGSPANGWSQNSWSEGNG